MTPRRPFAREMSWSPKSSRVWQRVFPNNAPFLKVSLAKRIRRLRKISGWHYDAIDRFSSAF